MNSTLDQDTASTSKANATDPREREILKAIDAFERIRVKWSEEPGEQPPGIAFWHAAADIVRVFGAGPIPAKLAGCVAAVESLGQFLCELLDLEIDFNERLPESSLWSIIEVIKNAIDVANQRLPALESIAELARQNVGVRQIALIHAMEMADVQQEISEPGSISVPGWISPKIKKLQEEQVASSKNISNGMKLSVLSNKLELMRLGTAKA